MDVIRFLCRYHNLQIQIAKKKEYIIFCDERSKSIPGPCFDKIGSSGTQNHEAPFVKWIYRKLDAETELKKLEEKSATAKLEIEDTISKLDDPELEMVLIYKYIDWLSWRDIAQRMYFSIATIRRKHDKALDLLKLKNEQA